MSQLEYIINHWVTVAWLATAALYVYGAVIADLVTTIRRRNKSRTPGNRSSD